MAIRYPEEVEAGFTVYEWQGFDGNPYLFCAVVPDNSDGESCPYSAPDQEAEELELWEPNGAYK